MKYIRIPAPVVLNGPDGATASGPDGKPMVVTFAAFVRQTLLDDPSWGKTLAGVRQSVCIDLALKDAGDYMALDDSWHDALLAVMAAPANGYNPLVARQILTFFDAIEKASPHPPSRDVAKDAAPS